MISFNIIEFGAKNDVNFEGRKTFDTVYNATKIKSMRDIETEVIKIIRKKLNNGLQRFKIGKVYFLF